MDQKCRVKKQFRRKMQFNFFLKHQALLLNSEALIINGQKFGKKCV
jgi:hypothetical protein